MPTNFKRDPGAHSLNIGGSEGNDFLYGSNVADVIKGFGGNDRLEGFRGNDFLQGGKGADVLIGGEGSDTADYSYSNAAVVISLANNTATGGEAQGDTFSGIENLAGSGYGDALQGDAIKNTLQGAGGNDILSGLQGDDVIDGGAGADVMQGGDGFDTLSYASARSGVIVGLLPADPRSGDAAGDTTPFFDFEDIVGSAYDDTLLGNGFGNHLEGGAGDDHLYGRAGNDWLLGGAGNDMLVGGEGYDLLMGQGGIDTLYGEKGQDQFIWSSTAETGTTVASADGIFDFSRADGDWIDLGVIDADIYAAADQDFHFIGTAAFSGMPGELRYYHADGDTFIEMQTGTSVDVEGVIRVSGIHTVDADWFFL